MIPEAAIGWNPKLVGPYEAVLTRGRWLSRQIEENAPDECVEKDQVLIGRRFEVESAMDETRPASKVSCDSAVVARWAGAYQLIETLNPSLSGTPDGGITRFHLFHVDREREEKPGVEVRDSALG